MFFQIERVEDVILDCDLDIVINNDGDVDGWCRLPWKFNRWSWWWRRSSQSERLSCGERCRRWLSSGWFDEESDFGVVVVVLGLNSRDYFAKFFIRKNCVLGECLRFNVEFVKRFRIRISRKFDVFEIVDRFWWRQLAVSSCCKCFIRCEESVFRLEKRCIQSFDPSSSFDGAWNLKV